MHAILRVLGLSSNSHNCKSLDVAIPTPYYGIYGMDAQPKPNYPLIKTNATRQKRQHRTIVYPPYHPQPNGLVE